MSEARESSVVFTANPGLTESQLDSLFAEAWGNGSARGYDRVLARSLCYFGAFRDSELVGFVNVGWDGGAHAFILDTIVRGSVRRRGIGLELVRRAITAARDAGVEWIHVDYEPHLDDFYGMAGLRPTKARMLHLTEPPRTCDDP
jgi:GNAT superfamily N-acetyltransferase